MQLEQLDVTLATRIESGALVELSDGIFQISGTNKVFRDKGYFLPDDLPKLELFKEATAFFIATTGIEFVNWDAYSYLDSKLICIADYVDGVNLESALLDDTYASDPDFQDLLETTLYELLNYIQICFRANKLMLADLKLGQIKLTPDKRLVYVDIDPTAGFPYSEGSDDPRLYEGSPYELLYTAYPLETEIFSLVSDLYEIRDILGDKCTDNFGDAFLGSIAALGYPSELTYWEQFRRKPLTEARRNLFTRLY